MNPERFRQIEELYHAAREATSEQRAALLAQTDPELRRQIESLLRQRTGGEFLDRPAALNAPELLGLRCDPHGLAAGACLGPYRIESKLGEGGMGEVFRAVDTRLGRAVAIKIAREQFSDRFEREARAISSLNHPNVCTLYDVGPNYLVMELVEGETIAALLKSGPLAMKTALLYASQIAGGAGRGARQGHRSPRSQARQRHDREIRRQGSGFRTGEIGPRMKPSPPATWWWARQPTWRRSNGKANRPMPARISTHSAASLYEMLTGARVGPQRRRIATAQSWKKS